MIVAMIVSGSGGNKLHTKNAKFHRACIPKYVQPREVLFNLWQGIRGIKAFNVVTPRRAISIDFGHFKFFKCGSPNACRHFVVPARVPHWQ